MEAYFPKFVMSLPLLYDDPLVTYDSFVNKFDGFDRHLVAVRLKGNSGNLLRPRIFE